MPTLAELGVTGFDVDLWYAVLAPAGTPKAVVDRYNDMRELLLLDPIHDVEETGWPNRREGAAE